MLTTFKVKEYLNNAGCVMAFITPSHYKDVLLKEQRQRQLLMY